MMHGFGVFQDGIMVASSYCADRKVAYREAMHYALVYGQDGPVEVREVNPTDLVDSEP